jgi:hypothetical protein
MTRYPGQDTATRDYMITQMPVYQIIELLASRVDAD